ncbi:porin family protein [uncultured Lacinutrix sp.]|uniref:porin family protein n=1 Tax=uncultured Lacinutrix sp. TaxID=574032 RepID=UPI00263380EC|nr:porin family protein [uncultured Lacinutrix sp.]
MKILMSLVFFLFFTPLLWSQEEEGIVALKEIDSLYKEDQFYIGVTYNLIGKQPEGLSQSGFSTGIHFGYTKDMPINKRRNMAIGLGLGLSFNSFNQNVLISETNTNGFAFNIINDAEINFNKNKFSTYMLELPLEFRWRTSTAVDYKFWRIYAGFKLGYVFANNTKFIGEPDTIKLSNIAPFNKFQYGTSISAGYNTWNFYFYYSLNSIFDSNSKIEGKNIDANAIKIGLIFFLL